MKNGIRIAVCAVLIALAATMAVLAIGPLVSAEQSGGFVLTEQSGRVAVMENGELHLTDIEMAGLRKADRERIARGVSVETQTQLLELLEDLGS